MLHDHELNTIKDVADNLYKLKDVAHNLNTLKDVAHNLYNLKDVAPTRLDKAAHGSPQQLLSAAKTSSVVKIDRQ